MEEIKKYIERKIKMLNEDISEFSRERFIDLEHFLKWDAENQFKYMEKLEWYKCLSAIDNKENLLATLKHNIEHLTDDIVFGVVRAKSTNEMANIMHVWRIEVKKEIIQLARALMTEIQGS